MWETFSCSFCRPTEYGELMSVSFSALEEDGGIDILEDEGIETRWWREQIDAYAEVAQAWEER